MPAEEPILKVLNEEINITPGGQPDRSRKPGQVGFGEAVLSIQNIFDDQERVYSVSISSPHKGLWKDHWFRLNPLEYKGNVTQAVTQVDDYRTINLPIRQGERRSATVACSVPQSPAARAGVYDILVSTRVSARSGKSTEQSTVIKAIIRPYHRWFVKPTTPVGIARIFRRSARFEYRIINEGNDWLYVRVRPTEGSNVQLKWNGEDNEETIAIPPPDLDLESSSRTFSITARAQVKFWDAVRGDIQKFPIPLIFTRIDAPSVAPLDSKATGDGKGKAGFNEAVTIQPADKTEPSERFIQPVLEFRPLIPKRWKDFVAALKNFFTWVFQNIKQIVMSVIGLIVAWMLIATLLKGAYEQQINSVFRTNESQITDNKGILHIKSSAIGLIGRLEVEYSLPKGDTGVVHLERDLTAAVGSNAYKVRFDTPDYDGKTLFELLNHKGDVNLVAHLYLPLYPSGWCPQSKPHTITVGTVKGKNQPLTAQPGSWTLSETEQTKTFSIAGDVPDGKPKLEGKGFSLESSSTNNKITIRRDMSEEHPASDINLTYPPDENGVTGVVSIHVDFPQKPTNDGTQSNSGLDPNDGMVNNAGQAAGATDGTGTPQRGPGSAGRGDNPGDSTSVQKLLAFFSQWKHVDQGEVAQYFSNNGLADMLTSDSAKPETTPWFKVLEAKSPEEQAAFAALAARLLRKQHTDDPTYQAKIDILQKYSHRRLPADASDDLHQLVGA